MTSHPPTPVVELGRGGNRFGRLVPVTVTLDDGGTAHGRDRPRHPRLRELVVERGVSPEPISETVNVLVRGTLAPPDDQPAEPVLDENELAESAVEKHTDRLRQITEASAEIPDVTEWTALSR